MEPVSVSDRLIELGLVLIGLAVLARIARRLNLPTIPLYLLAGLAFGEGGFVPLVVTQDFIRLGSEIGLILLLFLLGLEYSARELIRTLRRFAPAGALDVTINAIPGLAVGMLLGWGLIPALFMAGITMVSSSGIAAKVLDEAGWANAPQSRFVVSIAIFEDLAMVVLLPVLGALLLGGSPASEAASIALAIGMVLLVLLLALRVEEPLARLVFSRSDEALLLTILGLAIVFAGLAESVQVSAAVGALLAGILLSGRAAKDARDLLKPLRDLFAAFFFAFIGLSVDPSLLPPVLLPAAILALAGVATKMATAVIGGRGPGLSRAARIRAGAVLIARGEFSIAIAGLAVAADAEPEIAPLTVAYVIILAVVGPLVAKLVREPY